MNLRTDMAREAVEIHNGKSIEGVKTAEYEYGEYVSVNDVRVLDRRGEQNIGKFIGRYITVECEELLSGSAEAEKEFVSCVTEQLESITEGIKKNNVFIVGLGNRRVTPDAFGPKVCDGVFVTRHIKEYLPDMLDKKTAGVSAFCAGVLGETGIESFDVIEGIVKKTKPDLIIAVDALAAGSLSRLGKSLQLSNAGIAPGSGIGNKRRAISADTLGVPVVALGVPTVVYASVIFGDMFSSMAMSADADKRSAAKLIDTLQEVEGGDMIVTPKEIDRLCEKTAAFTAEAINAALYKGLTKEDINAFMS